MHHAHERQVWQIAALLELIEFTFPFIHAIKIRELVVVSAEKLIGDRVQGDLRCEGNCGVRIRWMPDERDPTYLQRNAVGTQVDEESVVAHFQTTAQR